MSIEPEDLNRGIITKTTSEPYDKIVKELSELLQRPNYKEQAEKLAKVLDTLIRQVKENIYEPDKLNIFIKRAEQGRDWNK